MIHLDKLLRVVGLIILVDVPGLELFWPDNLPE
jgi:ABC-type phosphate transport system auxiliary subunit